MSDKLWVVMPVYNEEACLERVFAEWLPVLRQVAPGFTFCALNDGSRDGTLNLLLRLKAEIPELHVVDKPNSGHGQSCLDGYRLALAEGADWIFQMDSDGQCDPRFFADLWGVRPESSVIYGFRVTRDDGTLRWVMSRVVSAVTFATTQSWVRDPNVPYRLMRRDSLEGLVNRIPPDFHLANILVAALQQKDQGIRWVNIHFRERMGGKPAVRRLAFLKQGWKLFRQLQQVSLAQAPAKKAMPSA